MAASLGVRVDTDNHGTRLLLTFGFTLAQTAILWLLQRHMLGQPVAWHGFHELMRAVVNAVVAVVSVCAARPDPADGILRTWTWSQHVLEPDTNGAWKSGKAASRCGLQSS